MILAMLDLVRNVAGGGARRSQWRRMLALVPCIMTGLMLCVASFRPTTAYAALPDVDVSKSGLASVGYASMYVRRAKVVVDNLTIEACPSNVKRAVNATGGMQFWIQAGTVRDGTVTQAGTLRLRFSEAVQLTSGELCDLVVGITPEITTKATYNHTAGTVSNANLNFAAVYGSVGGVSMRASYITNTSTAEYENRIDYLEVCTKNTVDIQVVKKGTNTAVSGTMVMPFSDVDVQDYTTNSWTGKYAESVRFESGFETTVYTTPNTYLAETSDPGAAAHRIRNNSGHQSSESENADDYKMTIKSNATSQLTWFGTHCATSLFGSLPYSVGNIAITKKVEGTGAGTGPFQFSIKFGGTNAPPNDTFSLSANETKYYYDIPVGVTYEVSETAQDAYTTTWTGKTGTVTANSTAACTATNTIKPGGLKVTKHTTGVDYNASESFSFTLKLTDASGAAKGGTFGGVTFDASNGHTFSLKHNESKTFSGLPPTWKWSLTESLGADAPYSSSIASGSTGTIQANSTPEIIVTNTRKTGKLTVKKVLTGVGADATKKFEFNVELKNGTQPVTGTYGGLSFNASGVTTFELAGGETKEISGIPTGYTYKVTEAASSATGYIPTQQGDEGTITDEASGKVATFTNELIRSDVRFVKKDTKTGLPMPGVTFRIVNKATGEAHSIMTDANGVADTSSVAHTTNTNKNDAGVTWDSKESLWVVDEDVVKATNGIWFQGKSGATATPVDDKGALPYGTYEVEELLGTANRGYEMTDPNPFSFSIGSTTKVDLGDIMNIPPDPVYPGPEHGNTTTIYKDSTPAPNSLVKPGATITYTLLVRNTGKDPQPRTIIRDYIPVGTEYDASKPASDGGVYVATSPSDAAIGKGRAYVEWAVDDLLPREEKTVSFTVKVLQRAGRHVFNTAYARMTDKTVTPGEPSNPEPTEESNTVMHRLTPDTTPSFVKTVKTSNPAPGTEVALNSQIAYTLHVENTGGTDVTNVGVFDPVPEGTECTDLPSEHSATLTADRRGIGWVIPELKVGASVDLHFTVTVTDRNLVKASGVVRNQASWGSLAVSGDTTPTPPTSNLDNTTDIIEHPLYEAPPEDAETYKWSDPAPETVVKNGDTITYELTTTNTGSATKPYVLIRDYIPTGTVYDETTPASDGGVYVAADAEGNETGRAYVEWVLEDLRPRHSVARKFSVKVTEDWRSYIRNRALSETVQEKLTPGDPSNPEPNQSTNEVKHPTTDGTNEDKFPFVRVIKGSKPQPNTMVNLGKVIAYTLDVENYSKATAYAVRVYDKVPEGTSLVGVDATEGVTSAATDDNGAVGWVIGEIAPGGKVTLGFSVKVVSRDVSTKNSLGDSVVRNQASWDYENIPNPEATPPASDEGMDNRTNIVEHPILALPNPQTGSQVTAYKDSDPAPNSVVKEGDEITYVVNLLHTGTSAQPATIVRDYIPSGTEYVEGSVDNGGVLVDGETSATGKPYVEWVLGEMRPGDKAKVSFTVKVIEEPPTFIRNMAIYSETEPETKAGTPATPDPTLHTNEVWHTTDPDEPTPEVVQVVKSSDPAPNTQVKMFDAIKYTLHVTNTGGSVATNYGVHDALQDGLELVDGSVSEEHHGTVTNDGRGVAWVIESLGAGESVDLSFSVRITSPVKDDIVQNQATWGKRESPDDIPDSPMENTSNIVEHPLLREPKPVITKTALTRGPVTTGQSVEFLVTVRNDGYADLVDHVLVDSPGEGLEYVSDDKGGIRAGDGKARWNGVTLKPGEKLEIRVTCRVTATQPGTLKNVAILYRPDGKKLVAIGEAEAIVVMIASDLIKTGVTLAVPVSAIVTGAIAFEMNRRKRI